MATQPIIRFTTSTLLILVVILAWPSALNATDHLFQCKPTQAGEMGPFYRPDVSYRTSIGSGYLLQGTVKSASDCNPIPAAMIELWMTGPEGRYGDAWRATLSSNDNGTYHFESHAPTYFNNRRPHIHIRITAEGFEPLVTQHYPVKEAGEGIFDLILIPSLKQ
jgi:protocatechuate 3,4-dioxygenase beta subunit